MWTTPECMVCFMLQALSATRLSGSDHIISKGQGHSETLSEVEGPVYFLLTVQCDVVARHITTLKNIAGNAITGSGEFVLMTKEKQNACATD